LAKILNKDSLFIPEDNKSVRRNPICVGDLSKIVDNALFSAETNKAYYARGPKDYSYTEIVKMLEEATGKEANNNKNQ